MRSGDELGSLIGTIVGESSLRRAMLLGLRRFIMELPREIAWSSPVRENHALLWAFESPMMIVSSSREQSRVLRLGLYPVRQQETRGT